MGTAQQAAGARQSLIRESNLGLVLRTVCAADAPLSRADVAALTSMTRSTVSRLVDDLVSTGLLDEVAPPTGRQGRPATPLVPGTRWAALGLQVNAGYLAARVVDLRGRVVGERLEAQDLLGSDPETTLVALGDLAADLLRRVPSGVRLVGAGLALPGIVSVSSGVLLSAPNLGWSDVRPADVLAASDRLGGLPLSIGNEADLAARTVAEEAPGRSGSHGDFVYLSGETGIGGAAVLDGRVMTGRHGWAGEVGHVCVDPDGPVCRCGSSGCLEQYAGKRALLAAAGLPLDASPSDLVARVEAGDPRASQAVDRAARALAVALAGVVNVLDIPTVVLGGHLGEAAGVLAPAVEAMLHERVLSGRWVRPRIVTAPADPAPGATGAALRELAAVLAGPAPWTDRATAVSGP
ncbi:MAG TPA: ROK family transcriptional regulator [Nocardioidaceae bacterium]|nr:ROK family transcriptional regulator [Nocardioidaceae bacterium]